MAANFYAQLAHDSLRPNFIPDTQIVLRPIKSIHDFSTQIVNELGTTDVAIGDATAEIMITTPGKIPNEMYYLEDTTPNRIGAAYGTELHTMLNNSHTTTLASIGTINSDSSEHSMLLFILVTALFFILLICCITACVIARSRSKHTFFVKRDMECSPECSGVNQPLLGLDKASDTTTKTSGSSAQN
ncbi:hypothetical protein X777_02712 [Ooceraea biroi]|uniref:Uncharacterized protein n=1 Tax=Ooceraea biroi TaxID=2015173 RepID=A0A026WMG6_OOCBI|nr:hypothetical protein X777_02712 [Ooceraea biroi]